MFPFTKRKYYLRFSPKNTFDIHNHLLNDRSNGVKTIEKTTGLITDLKEL